ncbi:MAG TPA: glycosyltransferase family 2 protein [Bryobacteraceae bacterium]|nr:glycosyltransferase family 2 protein [Bryobacteraceae bacterium]
MDAEAPPPDISVAVVNWNRREYLRACLDSLARQRGASFEIIVVDNGSSDGSAEMARAELGVRVIANTVNLGFCAANNQAFEAARGRFIALLNNDAEAEPDFLAELRRAFDAAPDIGMAAAKVLVYEDPRRIDKAGHLIYPDGQNRGRGTGETDHRQYDQIEECLWPDGCAAMYRKAMLDAIGGFDEDLFMFGDDAELGLRARIAGWRCLYMPGAVVRHHRGASLAAGSIERIFLIERNRVLLAAKLFPWRLLLWNPAYFALRLAGGLWAAAGGKGEMVRFPGLVNKLRLAQTILRADLAALHMLPRMLRKRREVRQLAKLGPAQVTALILRNRIGVRALVEKSN